MQSLNIKHHIRQQILDLKHLKLQSVLVLDHDTNTSLHILGY